MSKTNTPKLSKTMRGLREEYVKDRNNESVKVKVNLAGGLMKIGIYGGRDE